MTEYICTKCEREITREELEKDPKVRCPNCGSYEVRKIKEE